MSCGIEVKLADGTWRQMGGYPVQVGAWWRPGEHRYEPVPPCYLRCTVCGDVIQTESA